jgi:hypothetical protein
MPTLTRRRSTDAHAESWQIFYGDVQVGTIGIRAGVPVDVDQWGWSCGFYPRSHRVEHHDGTAETFERARADFEAAWRDHLPSCTEADFTEYRRQRHWTAWKYAMHAAAMKLPTQSTDGRARCFCGAEIVTATTARHVIEHHSNAIAA